MPYNPKSLINLAKGHQWQQGESGNPAGGGRDRVSQIMRCVRLFDQVEPTEAEVKAIFEELFELATKKHSVRAAKHLLNLAYGPVDY